MAQRTALLLGVALVAAIGAPLLIIRATRPKYSPVVAEITAAGYSWYEISPPDTPPRNLHLQDGSNFSTRLTFQHRGPPEAVFLELRLDTRFMVNVKDYQYARSEPIALPEDPEWATYALLAEGVARDPGNQYSAQAALYSTAGDIFLRNEKGRALISIHDEGMFGWSLE